MQGIQTSAVRWYKTRQGAATGDFGADAGALVRIRIDGKDVEAPEGVSLLSAASAAGIYIPALCATPTCRQAVSAAATAAAISASSKSPA